MSALLSMVEGALIWMLAKWVAAAMEGLPGTWVEVVDTAVTAGPDLPESVAEVAFRVPPFPRSSAVGEVMRMMPRLRVVQALTAGVNRAY